MNQEEYLDIEKDFLRRCDLVRLEAYATTGYEWMVVPKTGANRAIAAQHALFIQPIDGIDNDHDGKIDEPDELVTRADGGQSPHNYNLARDIVPMIRKGVIWWEAPAELWHKMGAIAEKHGLVWGGHFTSLYDAPHVEAKDWRVIRTAWKAGQIYVA
jgi:hypothetical protein